MEVTLEHERFGELKRLFLMPEFDVSTVQTAINQGAEGDDGESDDEDGDDSDSGSDPDSGSGLAPPGDGGGGS